jgi:hypothetical protein
MHNNMFSVVVCAVSFGGSLYDVSAVKVREMKDVIALIYIDNI